MKKKQTLAVLLAAAMVLSMPVGCTRRSWMWKEMLPF